MKTEAKKARENSIQRINSLIRWKLNDVAEADKSN